MLRRMDSIARVIEIAGGVSSLATKLGVKPPTVHQWKNGERPVPPKHALAMQSTWPGVVSVHDLRPDVFGPVPEKVPKEPLIFGPRKRGS